MVDSGIRRGADAAKAIALGADAVLIGRAPLWGVATGGAAGASRAIEMLQTELSRVMAQVGASSLADLRQMTLTDRAQPQGGLPINS